MAIFIDETTHCIIQGITGKEGQRAAKFMLAAGSRVIAGVRPGKAGEEVEGINVFDTVKDAINPVAASRDWPLQGRDLSLQNDIYPLASVITVPPQAVKDAVIEAIGAGVKLIIPIAEGVPVRDMSYLYEMAKEHGARIIGPNTVGIISPGKAKAGVIGGMDDRAYTSGAVGIISKSGGMTSETARLLTQAGIGQSTCVNIGGDKLIGTDFADCLQAFAKDEETKAVVLFGEIGGQYEEEAAQFIQQTNYSKPVVAFISGASAERWKGMTLGHAGAIIHGQQGTRANKVRALTAAGIQVVEVHHELVDAVVSLLKE